MFWQTRETDPWILMHKYGAAVHVDAVISLTNLVWTHEIEPDEINLDFSYLEADDMINEFLGNDGEF